MCYFRHCEREHVRLAVTAPWGIELNQDVLLVIEDNLIVVLGNDNGNWSILAFWNGLRFDAGLNSTRHKVVNKLSDILGAKLLGLVERELLVLDSLLDSKCGPLANLKVEVSAVLAKGLGVNGSKVDLALVFLSDWLELLRQGFTLFWGFGEDVGEWETGLESVSTIPQISGAGNLQPCSQSKSQGQPRQSME
jgi:hypothetical protein